jgi:hypothetical protein
MARPLAFGEELFAFAEIQHLALGQDGGGQEVEQALIGCAGVHVIQII